MCPMILYYQTQFIKVSCTTDQEIGLGILKQGEQILLK